MSSFEGILEEANSRDIDWRSQLKISVDLISVEDLSRLDIEEWTQSSAVLVCVWAYYKGSYECT